MSSYREPDYDDSVCALNACARKLVENPEPHTWQDNGFCAAMCAARDEHPFRIGGTEPSIELATWGSAYGGPGFERELEKGWREALRTAPHSYLCLDKLKSEDDPHVPTPGSWSWRVYLHTPTARICLAFRLTARRT